MIGEDNSVSNVGSARRSANDSARENTIMRKERLGIKKRRTKRMRSITSKMYVQCKMNHDCLIQIDFENSKEYAWNVDSHVINALIDDQSIQ